MILNPQLVFLVLARHEAPAGFGVVVCTATVCRELIAQVVMNPKATFNPCAVFCHPGQCAQLFVSSHVRGYLG